MKNTQKLFLIFVFLLLFVSNFIAFHNIDNVLNFLNINATATGTEHTLLFEVNLAYLYMFSAWIIIVSNIIYFVSLIYLIVMRNDKNES